MSAVVEPVGRLGQRPQRPLPKHWTAPSKAGIKGLPTRLPKAQCTEGPGSDANQTSRAFVYLSSVAQQHSRSAFSAACRRQTALRVYRSIKDQNKEPRTGLSMGRINADPSAHLPNLSIRITRFLTAVYRPGGPKIRRSCFGRRSRPHPRTPRRRTTASWATRASGRSPQGGRAPPTFRLVCRLCQRLATALAPQLTLDAARRTSIYPLRRIGKPKSPMPLPSCA
jgi:hypothetical protein